MFHTQYQGSDVRLTHSDNKNCLKALPLQDRGGHSTQCISYSVDVEQ